MREKPKFWFLGYLLIGAFVTFSSQAQVNIPQRLWTIQANALVEENNFAQAREKALQDAFKKAIKESLNVALGEKTFLEKAKLIEVYFYENPMRFVNRYRIISEKLEGAEYKIEVEVELSASQLQMELIQAGIVKSDSPDLLVMAIEQEKETFSSSWLKIGSQESKAETLLSILFKENGYRVVKSEPVFIPQALEQNLKDKNWLIELRRKYQAQAMVFAKILIKTEQKTITSADEQLIYNTEQASGVLFSVNCQLELYLIDLTIAESKLILKKEKNAEGEDLEETKNKVIERAINEIMPELILALEQILQKPATKTNPGQWILIEFSGLSSYFQYLQLAQELKKIKLIKNLELWGFAPKAVKFWIEYSGDKELLKKSLTSYQFQNFALLPVQPEKDQLRFNIQSLP